LHKVNEVESQPFAIKEDSLNPIYLSISTALLGINSGILAFISLYKFGFGAKFLSISSLIVYLNLSWHWVGYKFLFKNKFKA
jgi:hypothetical protein